MEIIKWSDFGCAEKQVVHSSKQTCMEAFTLSAYEKILREAYQAFNARDIDGVILHMVPAVHWPNGMEGGIEYGHEAVGKYWTRQWAMINPTVMPVAFNTTNDGRIDVTVHQFIKDLSGKVLVDSIIHHIYNFDGDKIRTMEIMNG